MCLERSSVLCVCASVVNNLGRHPGWNCLHCHVAQLSDAEARTQYQALHSTLTNTGSLVTPFTHCTKSHVRLSSMLLLKMVTVPAALILSCGCPEPCDLSCKSFKFSYARSSLILYLCQHENCYRVRSYMFVALKASHVLCRPDQGQRAVVIVQFVQSSVVMQR